LINEIRQKVGLPAFAEALASTSAVQQGDKTEKETKGDSEEIEESEKEIESPDEESEEEMAEDDLEEIQESVVTASVATITKNPKAEELAQALEAKLSTKIKSKAKTSKSGKPRKRLSPEDEIRNTAFILTSGFYEKNEKYRQKAINYLKRKAEEGVPAAQNNLGMMLYDGSNGLTQDREKGLQYLKAAAAKGLAQAQFNLAMVIYENEENTEENYRKMIDLFRLAAAQNLALAQYYLGKMHQKGWGVEIDPQEAVRFFKLAAKQGEAEAENELGLEYSVGMVEKQDLEKAFRLFRLAADKGLANAEFNCALFYLQGSSFVAKDEAEALRLYRSAADKGDASAQHGLAEFILADKFTKKIDKKEAIKLLILAANQGAEKSQYILAQKYATGDQECGVVKNEEEAYKFYRMAALQGHEKASHEFAQMLMHGKVGLENPAADMKIVEDGANKGDKRLQYLAGIIYMKGIGNPMQEISVKKDPVKAIDFYKKGAAQNCPNCLHRLEIYYNQGLVDNKGKIILPQSDEESFKHFKLSADLGEDTSQFNVGIMFNEETGTKRDVFQSLKYLALSTQKNHKGTLDYLVTKVMPEIAKEPINSTEKLNIVIVALHAIIQNNDLKFAQNVELDAAKSLQMLGLINVCKKKCSAYVADFLAKKGDIKNLTEFSKLRDVGKFLEECSPKEPETKADKDASAPSAVTKPNQAAIVQSPTGKVKS